VESIAEYVHGATASCSPWRELLFCIVNAGVLRANPDNRWDTARLFLNERLCWIAQFWVAGWSNTLQPVAEFNVALAFRMAESEQSRDAPGKDPHQFSIVTGHGAYDLAWKVVQGRRAFY
jgi:hypothetical protein